MMIKERYSNIELIRIVSMVMILSLHTFWGYPDSDVSINTHIGDNVLFRGLEFFRESACICAVDLFVLISGYFGISWKLKSICNLLFQVYFFVWIIYCVMLIFKVIPFDLVTFKAHLICPLNAYWFIRAYLLLYLVSPILNYIILKFSIKKIIFFILIFFFGSCLYNIENLPLFSTLYLLGFILRKYSSKFDKKLSRWAYFWLYLSMTIFLTILLCYHFLAGREYLDIVNKPYGLGYMNPLIILQAIGMFMFIHTYQIKNKNINYIAISVLAVYLLHMQPDLKSYFYEFGKKLYEIPVYFFYPVLILLCMFVFFVAVTFDKFRIFVYKLINNFIIRCQSLKR